MLLDRSGQGKVYQLISRRRFQQMEVLEGQNILVTVSGKKNRVRVYYLSWLKSKILRTEGVGGDQVMPASLPFHHLFQYIEPGAKILAKFRNKSIVNAYAIIIDVLNLIDSFHFS